MYRIGYTKVPREMRNRLGVGDSQSWNVCSIWCMQYQVYTILGVYCTRCWQMIMACRDRSGELSFVFIDHGRVEDEKLSDRRRWEVIIRNWDSAACRVRVDLPLPTRLVQLPIQASTTLIQGRLNPNRQVLPHISHICSYRPYYAHLHPPSLFLVHYSTIIAEHIVESSLSISPCHDFQLTLSTTYTKSGIHQVQYTLSTVYTKYNHTLSTGYTEY